MKKGSERRKKGKERNLDKKEREHEGERGERYVHVCVGKKKGGGVRRRIYSVT